jgi:hypothetical protein
MKVVTVATNADRYFNSLVDSAKKNNIELIVLGFGQKWQGFVWKFILMIDYLKNADPNEIILFIDAYDVIFIQDGKNIENKFLEIKKRADFKILFGIDQIPSNYIHKYMYNKVFNSTKNPNRINTGVYMGYAKDIYDILYNIHINNTTKETDDQILIIKEASKNPDKFYFDTKHEIVINLLGDIFTGNVDLKKDNIEIVYNNNKPYLKDNKYNTTPMILHAPGNGNIDDIIIKFNYKLTTKYNISKILYYKSLLKNFGKYFIPELTLISIILFIICYKIYKKYTV